MRLRKDTGRQAATLHASDEAAPIVPGDEVAGAHEVANPGTAQALGTKNASGGAEDAYGDQAPAAGDSLQLSENDTGEGEDQSKTPRRVSGKKIGDDPGGRDVVPGSPGRNEKVSPEEAAAIARVKNLEPRERNYSYVAAAVGAGLFCLVLIPVLHKPVPKGQLLPEDFLAIGLVMAAALAISTFVGRRALVAFSALFLSFMATDLGGLLLGLPFLALAGWLLIRSWRFNRDLISARTAASTPHQPARTSSNRNNRNSGASSRNRSASYPRSSSTQQHARSAGASDEQGARRGLFSRLLGRKPQQPELLMRPPLPPAASRRYTPPKSAVKAKRGREGR